MNASINIKPSVILLLIAAIIAWFIYDNQKRAKKAAAAAAAPAHVTPKPAPKVQEIPVEKPREPLQQSPFRTTSSGHNYRTNTGRPIRTADQIVEDAFAKARAAGRDAIHNAQQTRKEPTQ